MDPRRRRSRLVHGVRLAAATSAAIVAVLLGRPAIAAAAGPCTYTVNGVDLDAAATANQAIDIPLDADVGLSASGPGSLGTVRIWADFWPATTQVYTQPTTASSWSGTVRLSDQGVTVLGLYQITVDEDLAECPPSSGWVRLSGGSAFSTLPGAVGTGAAVVGVGLVLLAIRSALRGRGRLGLAAVGGAVAGLGVLVVSHQAGLASIDARSAGVWTVAPGLGSSVVTRIAQALAGAGHAAPTTTMGASTQPIGAATAPPDVAPGGPPPTAPAPPPTVPSEPPTARAEPPTTGGTGPSPTTRQASASDTTTLAEPPRTSYARIEAPDAVVQSVPFELAVGLTETQDVKVAGAPIVRPEWSHGSYTLTIQLVADGFERLDAAADPWRVDCEVTAEEPYPRVAMELRAIPTGETERDRQIRALYSVDGQAMGTGTRAITVVDDPAHLASVAPAEPARAASLSSPTGQAAPDITISIWRDSDGIAGAFQWQLLVRPGLIASAPSSTPAPVILGDDAPIFLLAVVHAIDRADSTLALKLELKGIGDRIRRKVPQPFWDTFFAVAAAVAPAVPTVQILSEEPHIPWELATLPDATTRPDASAPAILGAQADIGRWVLGEPPPRVPPPALVEVRSSAVISGVYPRAIRLEEAEAEAEALQASIGAVAVDAGEQAVLECLSRQPAYDVIHFAVHAQYGDPNVPADAGAGPAEPEILLADGTHLDEYVVMGCEPMAGSPLVFLNACQIGNGRQVLGDYAGMAAAFMYAGASGVIAPLWSVDDGLAREFAVRFYERVFSGVSPASAIRAERASFLASPETSSSTFVAYQYYGHPRMTARRAG